MRFNFLFLLFFLLGGLVSILAVIVDDTDPGIHYTPAENWVFYTYNTAPELSWVDDARVENRTLHHSNCTRVNDCHVRFTFTGVGITVYNVIRSTVNISMSLDQGPGTPYIFEDDLSCLNTDPAHFTQACYNRTTYHVESLDYGQHTLDIIMLGGTLDHFDYADYFLDYMDVDDTNPNSTSSQVSSKQAQAAPSTSFSFTLMAAVLGSVVGGIVLLSTCLLIVLKRCCRGKPGMYRDMEKYNTVPTPFSSMGSVTYDKGYADATSTSNSMASRGYAKPKGNIERPSTTHPPPQVRRSVSVGSSGPSSAHTEFGSDVKVKPTMVAGTNQTLQDDGPSTSTGPASNPYGDARSPQIFSKDAPPLYVP